MILKLAQSFLLTAALSTAAFPILPVLAQRTAQVQFEPGTSSAKLSGTITGQEYFDYILRAMFKTGLHKAPKISLRNRTNVL